ncbi:MAG UNVERIFIED_CONTAM: hypothetical protein LVT10_11400 [Anaerolineae bacterium]
MISALGSLVTFIVMVVFIITKFTSGAWFIVLLIPLMVWIFFGIHRHYKETAAKLRLSMSPRSTINPLSLIQQSIPNWGFTSAIHGQSWR